MVKWILQDAKNKFSAVVQAALAGVPQMVTRRGKPAVVMLAVEEYERLLLLERATAPTLPNLLLAIPTGRGEFRPHRSSRERRRILMYLIDTDVLSSLVKKNRDPRIVRWLESKRTADLYLSVVSIAEIESKIALLVSRSSISAQGMAAWLDSFTGLYGARILGVDLAIARRWGELSSDLAFDGADLLVAATALEKGLTLVTLRVPLFRPTGVQTADPSAVMVVA